jgi:uncharacterized protein (DUF3820 family)
MPAAATLKSPWKMNKAELTAELNRLGMVTHDSWLVPELRSLVSEARQETATKSSQDQELKGVTKLSLAELIAQAHSMHIPIPEKPTRGWLIRMLRDATATPADTIVPFGKFKGWLYREIPVPYLEWTVKETNGNPNAHPDLVRLATWAKVELERLSNNPRTGYAQEKMPDPEINATIPPPTVAEMRHGSGSSDSSWARVSAASTPKPRPRRTRRLQEMDSDAAEAEEEATEIDEIRMLETRLAELKDRRSLNARMAPRDRD